MTIEQIRDLCTTNSIRWTNHIVTSLLQRGMRTADIESALASGVIIEQYPADYPYPSCLVLGMSCLDTPIHIVCGASKDELWLITAYIPNESDWMPGYRTRKDKPE